MRRSVSDDQEMYRVAVERYKKIPNPEYKAGANQPYYITTAETYIRHLGPYSKLGTAKGILTGETWDTYENRMKWDAVGGWIEKAEITWTGVEL